MGLLAFAKRLPRLQRDKARRKWPELEQPSGELRGQTLLIVGAGAIGAEIARLAKAFGMEVLAIKRNVREPVDGVDELHPMEALHELAGRADAIVSVLPGTDATRGVLGEALFAAVRPGAVFVSVGRGSAVDEAALVGALRDGRLAGAALDVFEREPLPANSTLWELENVIISRTTPRACRPRGAPSRALLRQPAPRTGRRGAAQPRGPRAPLLRLRSGPPATRSAHPGRRALGPAPSRGRDRRPGR
jgi:phosphoglycerate dehydrogenase-like enzyme